MWAVVEQVIDNKIYVVFEDRTRRIYVNDNNLEIKECNQVYIENEKIISVKPYNKQLYNQILELQNSISKKNN